MFLYIFISNSIRFSELFSVLRREKYLRNDVVKFYILEIASALFTLQRQRVLYRNLKPETINLSIEGHVRLSDFEFSIVDSSDRLQTLCGYVNCSR
jgi:serine/threonine protein kinase